METLRAKGHERLKEKSNGYYKPSGGYYSMGEPRMGQYLYPYPS